MARRVTIPEIIAAKGKRKLTEVTAYDHPTALWVDESGIDMILVGDSLAMVVLGHEDTLSITMDEMLHHTRAVARTAQRALVIGDLPFLSYQVSVEQAVLNAGRFVKEARANAVKLEGGRRVAAQIKAIVEAQIPVQGHLGLTPQSSAAFGGFKIQGKTAEAARELIEDAQALVAAGLFQHCPGRHSCSHCGNDHRSRPCSHHRHRRGPECDGQVLVLHDLLGLFERFTPRFVKQYARLGGPVRKLWQLSVRKSKREFFLHPNTASPWMGRKLRS